jgi:hypothetical protein
MNLVAQIWTATKLALEALPQRLGPALVTVLGVTVVVAVMVSILAIGGGVRHFIDITDQPERAVVLSASSPSEFAGSFDAGQVAIIESAPGVRHLPNGQPMVQPQAAAPILLARKADGVPGYLFLRGTRPARAGGGPRRAGNVPRARHRRPGDAARRALEGGRRLHDRRRHR